MAQSNLHVLDPFVSTTDILELTEADLSNNSAKLATCSRDTVGCRTVASRENFSRNDEGSGVGAEVLEEVSQAV